MMSEVNEFDRQHVGQMLEDPARYDWLACHIIRLIAKAAGADRELLRRIYPDHVAAYEAWFELEGKRAKPRAAPMSQLDSVADRVAVDLFTNGGGEHADRLVLIAGEKRDLGGWSIMSVRDRVMKILTETFR